MRRLRPPSLLAALALTLAAAAQTAPATYWVQFTDKAHTPYSLSAPEAYLSPRAIERREHQHIAIDSLDLPVDPAYVTALLAAGQFSLHSTSKWSNAVTIVSTDTAALDTLTHLPFVRQLRSVRTYAPPTAAADKFPRAQRMALGSADSSTYGPSLRQIAMMNGHLLHELGSARGEGMLIGILDSGFDRADSLDAFSDLRAREGIRFTRDLVLPGGDVYRAHWHGRSVLSVMAGHLPGRLLGTAPAADYVLLRTEDADSENLVEEDNWVAGAELADSIGCDVLNTSLGYTQFDDSTQDHVYADLDGRTTRIAIAANIASRKGMIPVISAGNSGAAPWHYISTPADAIDVLTVGAVDQFRQVAGFSSRGPSADGRVKPDVSAMGSGTVGLSADGSDVAYINGTSFSSPLVCGLTACLWQLHRDRSAHEIMDAVRRSASHFATPNDSIGHGIPDYWRAHLLLGGEDLTGLLAPTFTHVYPLPFSDHLDIELYSGDAEAVTITMTDALGRTVLQRTTAVEPSAYQQLHIDDPVLGQLRSGAYVLIASLGGRAELTRTVVKLQ